MEERGSVGTSNRSKEYKNGGRSTSKAIMNYTKAPLDNFFWKNGTAGQANSGDDQDFLGDFSWPPRSYTCTFCKREFRSAQALGGHMNVHRREKARLRQITPPRYLPFLPTTHMNLVPNPNPNPNFSTTFASNITSFPYMIPPIPYTSCVPFSAAFRFNNVCSSENTNVRNMRSEKSDLRVHGFDDFSHEKKSENGLNVQKFHDLDLELRLGCS